jgi:hypothetical protein
MDEKAWAAKNPKVLRSRNISVTTEYLSPDYRAPSSVSAQEVSGTGFLALLRIEPKNPGHLPSFVARWDHDEQGVDIDLQGGMREKRSFKHGKKGYRGHKTTLVMEPVQPRKYAIDIETPRTGPVFKGSVSLAMDFALSLDAGMHAITGDVSAHVARPWWRQLLRRFRKRNS